MARKVPFIGRGKELQQIEKFFRETGTLCVICVFGPGGIGKTRLLEEIEKCFAFPSNNHVLMPAIIDFDNLVLTTPESAALRVIRSLGENHFDNYFQELQDLRKMENSDVSAEKLGEQGAKVLQTLAEDFNRVTSIRRVVLRYDSIEKLDWPVWESYVDVIKNTKNVLYVIAGRHAVPLQESLHKNLGKSAIFINLGPLKTTSRKEYLTAKQNLLHTSISPKLADKLLFLSDGRPILLDLAVEWLSRDYPLTWMTEETLPQLKKLSPRKINQRKDDFRMHLVHHIRQIRSPMDQLMLLMSRIYPLNRTMIANFLKISDEKAQKLFEQATSFAFVKHLSIETISLHDEMREMVLKYVWPEVDKDGDRRRRDSDLAVGYLEQQVRSLTKQADELAQRQKHRARKGNLQEELNTFLKREELDREIWALREQLVLHSLYIDVTTGITRFVEAFDEALKQKRYSTLPILLEQVENFRDQLPAEAEYEFGICRVKWLLDQRKSDQAKAILDELMQKYGDDDGRKVNMLTRLARIATQEGEMLDAIEHLSSAVDICQKSTELQQTALGHVLNTLGRTYRLVGYWKEAEEKYHQALDLIRKTGDQARLAAAYNNLGFIVGLQSDYESALRYCRQALRMQENHNLRFDSGRTHNTMGIIYRGKKEYLAALEHANQAIAIFREFKDIVWLAWAYCERGATKWQMKQIDDAKSDLDKSYKLSTEANLQPAQAVYLHRVGHIYMERGEYKKAEECFKKSAALAGQAYNYHQTVTNLQGLVELYYSIGYTHHLKNEYAKRDEWYKKTIEMAEQWRLEYEERKKLDFPLYTGSRLRILGDIAYDRKEFKRSLAYYKQAFPKIASRGGYSVYALTAHLDQLQERIDLLPPAMAITWCDQLEKHWKKQGLHQEFPEMISVCEICRDAAIDRMKRASDTYGGNIEP